MLRDLSLRNLLTAYLRDPASGWVCGGFGALAEFTYDPGEAVTFLEGDAVGAVSARGAFRLDLTYDLKPVAYETLSKTSKGWGQGLVLCLPADEARMGERTVVTELGPDRDALRPQDRDAILFDLGIGKPQSDICVRTSDPVALEALRAACGRPLFEPPSSDPHGALAPKMPALSPHRVFRSKAARIEVYQPIPPPDGKTPEGPHTHVREKLVAHRRSHAATVPVPKGFVPALWLFPAHPLDSGTFDRARHDRFQELIRLYGEATTHEGKRAVEVGLTEMDLPSRAARYAFRIAQKQKRYL